MLKTSQKFPEKSLSHSIITWLAVTENFWDHFPPINFEPIWLYWQKKVIIILSHHCCFQVKVEAMVIESLELIFSLSHWIISRARITMSQSKYYQNMIFGHWLIYLIFSYKSSFFILSQSEYYDIAIPYFKWLNLYHAENISKVSWEVT